MTCSLVWLNNFFRLLTQFNIDMVGQTENDTETTYKRFHNRTIAFKGSVININGELKSIVRAKLLDFTGTRHLV